MIDPTQTRHAHQRRAASQGVPGQAAANGSASGRDGTRSFALCLLAGVTTLSALTKISVTDPLQSIGGVQSLYELPLLLLITSLLFMLVGFRMPLFLLSSRAVLPVLLYSAFATLSSLWSLSPLLSLGKGIELMILVINAVLFVFLIHESRLAKHFYGIVASSIMVVTIVFLFVNYILWDVFFYFTGERERLNLGYNDPLSTADMTALGLLCAGLSKSRLSIKTLQMIFFAALLVLTKTRGSLLGATLAIMVFGFVKGRYDDVRFRRLGVLALVSMAFLAVLAFFAITMGEVLDDYWYMLPEDVADLNGRWELWATALELATADLQSALVGYGYFASRWVLLPIHFWAGQSHQVVLEVLLTTGLVGLAMFAYFGWSVGRMSLRNGSLLTVASYVGIVSWNEAILFQPRIPMVVLMWVLAHVLIGQRQMEAKTADEPSAEMLVVVTNGSGPVGTKRSENVGGGGTRMDWLRWTDATSQSTCKRR